MTSKSLHYSGVLLALSLLLCLLTKPTQAQVDFEFWFAAPELSTGHVDRPIRFVLTSFGQPSTATVSMPANPLFAPITVNIGANATEFVDLTPWINLIESAPGAQVLNSGLLISSSNPITAYYEAVPDDFLAYTQNPNNPDIFTLKGQNALDTEFYIPQQNYFNNQPTRNPDAYAWFIMVASEDNTTITVDLTQDAFGHTVAGNPHVITLDRGETYAFRPPNNVQNGPAKFGGSRVTSDKPISITVSDDSNYGWTNLNAGGFDLIGDQIVGTSQIGTDYVVVRGPGLDEERIFIYGTVDGTEIYINDTSATATPVTILNSQDVYSFGGVTGGATFIHATEPVYVFHVSGYPKDNNNPPTNDNSEIGGALVPPLGCSGSSEIAFSRVADDNFALVLLVDSVGIDGFTATSDGANVPILETDFDTVPGTNGQYYFYYKTFDGAGNSFIENEQTIISNSKAVFHCGMFNGDDPGLRYGYFSGFTTVQLGRDRAFCREDTVALDAGILNQYNWFRQQSDGSFLKIDSTRYLNVVDSGTYVVTDNSINQCLITDTVKLDYYDPVDIGLTPDTSICEKTTFTFQAAVDPSYRYLWSTGDTTNSVTLNAPDTFRIDTISVILTDSLGCRSYDTTYTAFDTVVTPSINGADASGNLTPVCISNGNVTYTGTAPPNANYLSYFAGPGVIEPDSTDDRADFNPIVASDGNHLITYTFIDTSTEGNCAFTDSVYQLVIPIISAGPDTQVCRDAAPFQINVSPAFDTLYSSWIRTSSNLDTSTQTNPYTYTPSIIGGADPYHDTLIYQFETASGCLNTDTAYITVFNTPPSNNISIGPFCADSVGWDSLEIDLTQYEDSFTKGISVYSLTYFSSNTYNPASEITNPNQYVMGNGDQVFIEIDPNIGTCPPSQASSISITVDTLPSFPALADTSGFCSGDTLTLDASPSAGYSILWSTAETSTSIQVSTAGTYWVRKTDNGTGCISSDTLPLIVNPLPAFFLTNQRVCAGENATFNAHAAGSSGAAGDFDYLWSNNSTLSFLSFVAPATNTTIWV